MNILLIEDDKKISEFIELGLQNSGYSSACAYDGKSAWNEIVDKNFDAIILDIMLPDTDGLSLLTQMRAQNISTPVLILSAKKSLEEKIAGLESGGDDYLVKPFAMAELIARLQAITRRSAFAISTTSETGAEIQLKYCDLIMNLETRDVFRQDKKIILQVKEFALLDLLLRNQEKVITKAIILEKIWGYDFDPQTNVVDVLVCRLRNKIDKDFSEKIIQTHRGVGYVLKKD